VATTKNVMPMAAAVHRAILGQFISPSRSAYRASTGGTLPQTRMTSQRPAPVATGFMADFLVVIVSPSPAINTLLTISGHRSSGASGHSVRESQEARQR
jgi:hypothetical protein